MLAITHRVYETTLANSCVVLSRLFEKGISIHYVSNTSESQFCSDCNKRSSEVFSIFKVFVVFLYASGGLSCTWLCGAVKFFVLHINYT